MEVKECGDERWAHLMNSIENSIETEENGIGGGGEEREEDDNDEALSLCDLPLVHQSRMENEEYSIPVRANETDHQEDFDFCSMSKEFEMCAADEVFYQGQILPLRRSIRRSESMDRYFPGGLISSRSSSISSHHSSSTSGSGSSTATTDTKFPPPRNHFHSHPSPSPKVHVPARSRITNRNCTNKSSPWNVFRLGLVAPPPEIAFHDLKARCPSNNSSKNPDKKKIKPWDFLGRCKCSVDTVPSNVVIIKRSASDGVTRMRAIHAEEESLLEMKSPKKRSSHRRTFEWLKQLSLEGAASADEP